MSIEEYSQNSEIVGSESRLVQYINDAEAGRYQQDSIIQGDYNLVIQIIGDMHPKQFDLLLQDGIERQALAKKIGLTERALQVFFNNTAEESVPIELLPKRLCEIAKRFQGFKEKFSRYNGTDERIRRLKIDALSALSELDWNEADSLLKRAADRDIEIATEAVEIYNQRMTDAADNTCLLYTSDAADE